MGYPKHVDRVGAFAVTLGVGVAMAMCPGIAFAEPSDPSAPDVSAETSTSSSANKTTPKTKASAVAGSGRGDDTDSPVADAKPALGAVDSSKVNDPDDVAKGAKDAKDAEEVGAKAETPPATRDESSDSSDDPGEHTTSKPVPKSKHFDDVDSPVTVAVEPTEKKSPTFGIAVAPTLSSPPPKDPATTFTTAVFTPVAPAVPQVRSATVSVVSDLVAAVLQPFLRFGTGTPLQVPVLWAMLSAVRDEMERILIRRTGPVAVQQPTAQLVSTEPDQHVLVIGIDGTNLSRVLADPTNENFFDLMDDSTNSAPSIVGHTTISNPSWTAILTGAWDNQTGVINNVFTPWTYDKWPTVFTQLETYNPAIDTKAIADWDVVAAIAASGVGADDVDYIAQLPGDTNWSATDAAVTEEAVKSIEGTVAGYQDVPEFLFTYLVQVDENGHMFGGASEEYKQAIQRTDDNLGAIMEAVENREAATGEEWTVIVVTDHGHQPQKGFGHGFQTPDETATFVIARGTDFGDGYINTDYQIVDVTPTVLDLFDAPLRRDFDGLPLTALGAGVDPGDREDLQNALKAQLASNHAPNLITNVALSARTIFAFVPYYVFNAGLPGPIGDVLYVVTNVPAQIVAWLTGIRGASIFPLLPPPPASSFIPDSPTTIDCADANVAAAACIAS